MTQQEAYIVTWKRTPFTPAMKGALTDVRPDDMIAAVIKTLPDTADIPAGDIEDVLLGCAFPEGEQGLNLGRMAVLLSGLPVSVAGCTVNRFCGSAMQAIHSAAGSIALGAGHVYMAGGVESMSRVPTGGFSPMPHPGLYESMPDAYEAMGVTAENLAEKYKIPRKEQEEFALASHKKAAAAEARAAFAEEIVPVTDDNGETVAEDGCIRAGSTLEAMAGLKPAFTENGTVTAATASPLTDGAVCAFVCSGEYVKAHGLQPLAKIKSFAVSGCEPGIMGIGPVQSTRKALKNAGLSLSDISVFELNEAFAAQALAVLRELEIPGEKLNIHGGAIALGHPLGASGARITCKAASLLKARGGEFALATMCIGGGQGIATVLEAV